MIGTRILATLLILLGLGLMLLLTRLALSRNVFEAMALVLPSIIVFRSGIRLMRMATVSSLIAKLKVESGSPRDSR